LKFISTHDDSKITAFYDAMMRGLAPDGGLYIPAEYPWLAHDVLTRLSEHSLLQLGEIIMCDFLPEIQTDNLNQIVKNTLSFPIPLRQLEDNIYLLEVFHGPTLSFKDVGARFMANIISYYMKLQNKEITILVATSGDTGSAIANAFHNMPNIHVFVLYPSQKITHLQEQQMTTLGDNIHALEVLGTFDDCQRMVKTALLDDEIRAKHSLTTANSINISRLLPQIIYHSWAVAQLKQQNVTDEPVLIIPSGNLGNLTAAVYAKAIGMPIHHYIAAMNKNSVFAEYLLTGKFNPQPSQTTLSNAMDVGNPSNFERLKAFYENDHLKMTQEISCNTISDEQTLMQIRTTYDETGYILDPHTAVGVVAAHYVKAEDSSHITPLIVTATAHPAKFPEVIKSAINIDIELPERLRATLDKPKQSIKVSTNFDDLKKILLTH
jgi:threonine synthase